MNARRRLLTAVSAAGALLALTACEKPTPIVTVVSGGESVYTEASTWCFEEQTPPDCAERKQETKSLAVRGGETIGIDVGKEVAEGAWLVELSDPAAQGEQEQPQRSEPQSGHYFSFDAPNLPSDAELLLTVRSVDDSGEPSGEWSFRLSPKR